MVLNVQNEFLRERKRVGGRVKVETLSFRCFFLFLVLLFLSLSLSFSSFCFTSYRLISNILALSVSGFLVFSFFLFFVRVSLWHGHTSKFSTLVFSIFLAFTCGKSYWYLITCQIVLF